MAKSSFAFWNFLEIFFFNVLFHGWLKSWIWNQQICWANYIELTNHWK